jgi:hypothetical protein
VPPFDLTPLPIREVTPGLLLRHGPASPAPQAHLQTIRALRNFGRVGRGRTAVASAPGEMSPCLIKEKQELPS